MHTEIKNVQEVIPLDDLLSSVSYAHIDRQIPGIVSLFMCHVLPGSTVPGLPKNQDFTRIDFVECTGGIHAWKLVVNLREPDLIITRLG
jgi:hypothetical protein